MQDLLVMYRQTQPSAGKLAKLRQRIVGPNEQESTPKYQQRNSINMRIYRDIPVPSWKIVFPNKLLQFRPLDGLRSDLVSIAGLLCTCASYTVHALPLLLCPCLSHHLLECIQILSCFLPYRSTHTVVIKSLTCDTNCPVAALLDCG